MLVCRRLQIDPYLSPCTKLKSRWIKDLNINSATLNLLEEKMGGALDQTGAGNCFLNITPVAQTLKSTINKWDILKLGSFFKAKNTVDKTKQQLTVWGNFYQSYMWQRIDLQNIHELKKLVNKTPNSPI